MLTISWHICCFAKCEENLFLSEYYLFLAICFILDVLGNMKSWNRTQNPNRLVVGYGFGYDLVHRIILKLQADVV